MSLLFFILSFLSTASFSQDPVMDAMRDEISRNISRLKDSSFPLPYFISYSVYDIENCSMDGNFGKISSNYLVKKRTAKIDLRIGTSVFDSSNFATDLNRYLPFYMDIPADDNYDAVRWGLWYLSDEAYKNACEIFSMKKAYREKKAIADFYPEISQAPVVSYVSPESTAELRCDVYRDILERVSNVSKKYPKVKSVDFTLNISKNIMRFADSENRYFRKNSYQIVMRADIDFQDEKGYIKKDFKDFFYFSVEDFEKKAIADAEGYIKMFSDSYPAQEIDYFAAPCIFEKDAAFELINSLFVRNISFFPPPETEDENYLKYYYSLPRLVERIGKRVFPNFIDVYDDAGIKIYNGIQLVGAYDIDDEGVMPVKLRLVESGVLKTFYSSKRPSKYISYSNGRGRGNYDMYVYPFPSNVFIKSSKTYSDERFMKNVKKYAYEQGYDEVIFVEKIASSIKDTSKPIQSPVVAYIMNLKNGEKRYVTNIDFEDPGTRILRDILFTSEKEYVVNFFEKGPFYNSSSVAASLVVPEKIFVREIGLVKSQDKPQKKTYIPHPYFGR